MGTEGSKRGLVFISLAFALVFLMAIVATPVLAPAVISEPGGTIIEVPPDDNFMLRFRLRWDEEARGRYAFSIDWFCPENRPEENFTFLSASAYFDNLDSIDATVDLYEGPEGTGTRYNVVVATAKGDPRNGEFNVDVRFRAAGVGGVDHIPTENHPMHLGTISVYEDTTLDYAPPNPYITVRVPGRGVDVSISPRKNSGLPGMTLDYTVTVKNVGTENDNYTLDVDDNLAWGATVSPTLLTVLAGENKTATLSVTVPENVVSCTEDNIKVTAASQADSTVSDNDTCIAHAENVRREVEVSISPSYQSAPVGTALSYTVIIRNTGNVVDNYALTVSDTEDWDLSLPENRFENVAPDQDRTAMLNVMILENAVPCTRDNITVTATSQADNTVKDNASSTAHAIEREVEITISPSSQRGGPDDNIWGEYDLEYTVTVTNRSAQPDNYTLTVHDTLGWDLRLVGSLLLGVPAGENRSTTLYVKVPAEEKPGTEDTIVITATSQTDTAVSNYASCVAQSGVIAFEMSVSPSQQRGIYIYDLEYIVRVTNRGTLYDSYTLMVNDTLGWDLRFARDFLSDVPPGENKNEILYVGVHSNEEPGTKDTIIVTVTSRTDNTVSDNADCTAYAALVDMKVTISPSYQRGSPGETLVYLLTVKNTGDEDKPTIYSLPSSDNAGWGPTIDDNQLTIQSGKSATTRVRVRVPDNVKHRTMDNLTVSVSAPSQVTPRVYTKVSSIAQAETLKLFISPSVDSARPGENLTFTMWVTNVDIENDNYTLEVRDDAGWGLSLRENSLKDVTPGESRQAMLTITISEDAEPGTEDNVKITVIPGSDPTASESENCVAIAAPPMGVRIAISPKSRVGLGGATITYAVIVKNVGTENDNYDLTVSDDAGWVDNITFSENLLVIPGLERRGTILEVIIPHEAAAGTVDNIFITVTSRTDNTVSASASCAVQKGIPVWIKKSIVRGDGTGYNLDSGVAEENGDPSPEVWYSPGDYPPLMVAKRVENGGVVAAGLVSTCRDGKWNYGPAVDAGTAKLDVLLDKAFQWMVPGAKKVLWYEGFGDDYYVYNDTGECSQLKAALEALGYTVTGAEFKPITASQLEPYDIMIVPELQIPKGEWEDGGDPSLLEDNDVQAIADFVKGGRGLLVMEGTDHHGYNYCKVQNKILRGLGIDDVYFQSDQVNQNGAFGFDAEVTDVDFGSGYRAATGLTRVQTYSTCSLVVKPEKEKLDVSIEFIPPNYLEGLPGETLTYTLTINNTGKLGDTYIFDAADNAGFASSVSPPTLSLAAGASDNATLSVTIPEGTPRGTESRIAVAVTSVGDPTLGDVSYVEAWGGALSASVSISPENRSGRPGENLRFFVFVTNTGDFDDNYTLTVSDNLGWGSTVSPDNLTLSKGEMDLATLWVTIPENAIENERARITVTATSRTDNRVSAENSCTALVTQFGRGVNVSISEDSKSGAPGEELTYTVTVTNTGDATDTFSVEATDTAGWDPTLSTPTTFSLDAEGSINLALRITIPSTAAEDNSTTITVTASGTGYDDSATCTARAAVIRGVEISILPASQSGYPEKTLTFTVTVKNTGDDADSYELTVSDNAGWGAALAENLLTIPAGENQPTTVRVTVPSGAEKDESTMITVTATSRGDRMVSDNATCTAKAREKPPGPPIVPIGVGGAAIGGGIAVTLLLKKGMISLPFLRSRQRRMFSRMDLSQSRPLKRSLLTPRPFHSNPAKARKSSKKWL